MDKDLLLDFLLNSTPYELIQLRNEISNNNRCSFQGILKKLDNIIELEVEVKWAV